jgi:hypothetical protein
MWEIEQFERAGIIILIFYFFPQKLLEGQDKTLYTRGQVACNDKTEVDLWLTVLPILNLTSESET